MKTHWKKLKNPDYLGAYELIGVSTELKVKIKNVEKQKVKGSDGKEKDCIVANIEGYKPMILNATNCKIISKIYNTPLIEDWAGKEIIIYVANIDAFGDKVDCLRIKPIKPEKEKLTQLHPKFNDAKKALKSKSVTIEQIKLKYDIDINTEKLLQDGN